MTKKCWLPGLVAQSVLVDRFPWHVDSLERRCHRERVARKGMGSAAVVTEWRDMLVKGLVKNRAELARREGVSRARVTQALRGPPVPA